MFLVLVFSASTQVICSWTELSQQGPFEINTTDDSSLCLESQKLDDIACGSSTANDRCHGLTPKDALDLHGGSVRTRDPEEKRGLGGPTLSCHHVWRCSEVICQLNG